VVDGLAPGGIVYPDSTAYKAYSCHPSDQFPGFTWCAKKQDLNGKFGPYQSWETLLHSGANTATLVLQDMMPAMFAPGDAEREIQRLSQGFGQSAQVYRGESRAFAPHTVIATWGAVTLTPLDEATMERLRRGDPVAVGLVVDFIGDSRRSAREGLPVFHIGGGAGFIWAAQFDDSGRGRLRVSAVDASLLPVSAPPPSALVSAAPSQPADAPAPVVDPSPAPSPASPQDPGQVERDRAARAEKAIAAGNLQLKDVEAFIQQHPQSARLLDYVDRLNALKAAVRDGNPDEVEARIADLSSALSHDADFQQHLGELAAQQKRQAAQFLGDAIRRGDQERKFLLDFVAKNPLAEASPTFTDYIRQLSAALQRADLEQLQPLVEKVDVAIREASLEAAFVGWRDGADAAADAKADKPAAAASAIGPAVEKQPTLPITEKNRFLVAGALDDLEILYNAGRDAPHVALNLRGDFVFSQNQARVCLFGQSPPEIKTVVRRALTSKAGPRPLAIAWQDCDPHQLERYDVVGTQRNAFLRSKPEDALALLKAVEVGNYRPLSEISAADLAQSADAERANLERIKTNIADGAPDGFGLVLLRNGASTVCLALAANVASHRLLLLKAEDTLDLELEAEAVLRDTNIDDAFIDAQKRQCGAVYASAADLKALTVALTRAEMPFGVSTVWIAPSELDQAEATLKENARVEAQEQTERAQRNADLVRLAAARAKDANATQAAQESTLRQKFGDMAKAALNSLGSEVVAWTKDQTGPVANAYPAYVAWTSESLANHWEVTSVDTGLRDFGVVSYKARALEAVLAEITVHLKNRMLGEYRDECFVFGRVNDAEFAMAREPIFARCSDETTIRAWQAGHQFKSEWVVSN